MVGGGTRLIATVGDEPFRVAVRVAVEDEATRVPAAVNVPLVAFG